MLKLMDELADPADESPVLPLPEVVDTPAVVFAGLLAGGRRPLVLDAASVREIEPPAAPLLATLLRAKRDAGAEARIANASATLRRRWERHALGAFFAGTETPGIDSMFTCPDRDELGFSPSLR
jgi:hypothetical protein